MLRNFILFFGDELKRWQAIIFALFLTFNRLKNFCCVQKIQKNYMCGNQFKNEVFFCSGTNARWTTSLKRSPQNSSDCPVMMTLNCFSNNRSTNRIGYLCNCGTVWPNLSWAGSWPKRPSMGELICSSIFFYGYYILKWSFHGFPDETVVIKNRLYFLTSGQTSITFVSLITHIMSESKRLNY